MHRSRSENFLAALRCDASVLVGAQFHNLNFGSSAGITQRLGVPAAGRSLPQPQFAAAHAAPTPCPSSKLRSTDLRVGAQGEQANTQGLRAKAVPSL
eukprot:scaffold40_cov413-Prasinococcus_capsulatus_cf.AAC.12